MRIVNCGNERVEIEAMIDATRFPVGESSTKIGQLRLLLFQEPQSRPHDLACGPVATFFDLTLGKVNKVVREDYRCVFFPCHVDLLTPGYQGLVHPESPSVRVPVALEQRSTRTVGPPAQHWAQRGTRSVG